MLASIALDDIEATPAGELDPGIGELECGRLPARCSQHPGVATGTSADVERPGGRDAFDGLGDDVTPLTEPPVAVFEVGHVLDLRLLHESRA